MKHERVIAGIAGDRPPRKSPRKLAEEAEAARAIHRGGEETEGSLARIEARRRASGER